MAGRSLEQEEFFLQNAVYVRVSDHYFVTTGKPAMAASSQLPLQCRCSCQGFRD